MRVDPNYVANLSQSISLASNTEQKLSGELSSGLRVSTLSDDAVAVSANVQLTSSIGRLDSFVQSSSRQQSLLQVADSALSEVVSQVTSALSLGVTAGNGTLSPANLSAIAQQLSGVRDNVLSIANSSYQGKYIFSGSQGDKKPFSLDESTTPASITYQGDASVQNLETPDGQKLPMNVPGSNLFTAAGADLLGALNQLVSDLKSGATGSVPADTAALGTALSHLSNQRSTLDSSLNRLTATTGYAQTQESLLQVQQSQLLSVDRVKVITDLKTAETQHQALLSVVASLSKLNLFDYLK